MSLNRRSFITKSSIISAAFAAWDSNLLNNEHRLFNTNKIDWEQVRSLFPITRWDKVHFNSGSAGVMPLPVQENLIQLIKLMNEQAPYETWSVWSSIKKNNIERIAKIIGASPSELQIVRNTTEGLNMIIYGLKLKANDEVIISNNEYPFAVNAWYNRALRDKVTVKKIEYDPTLSDEEILKKYEEAISPNTKVIQLTHITHREGQIMPIKKIISMAHQKNIEVVVDGAHSFAQIDFNLSEISAEYYASSLHKWLNAPHGTGLLFIKENRISQLHNHPSSNPDSFNSIDKFEHIGTRAFHQEIGVSAALDFHELLGFDNKINRLNELKSYWTKKVKSIDEVVFHTNLEDQYSCAIATISIKGYSGSQLVKILDEKYDIHIKSVSGIWGSGIRVSVNVFTSLEDLDRLTDAIIDLTS